LLTCGDAEKAHAESSANDEQTKAIASISYFPQAQELLVGIASQSEPRMGESLRSIVGRHEEATQTKITTTKSIINMNELIDKTRQWFHDKGIIENSNPLKQLWKTQEELTETRDAVVRYEHLKTLDVDDIEDLLIEQYEEIKDGIGDQIVTLIGVCEMYGFSLEECLQMAYDTISKRNGKMIDGIFVKSN
jgi:NTP pyrophosphatase (non-canonical NTP hydrolase)